MRVEREVLTTGVRPPLPELDEFLRLATAFVEPPTMRRAPPDEITLATRVREEDVAHDQRWG